MSKFAYEESAHLACLHNLKQIEPLTGYKANEKQKYNQTIVSREVVRIKSRNHPSQLYRFVQTEHPAPQGDGQLGITIFLRVRLLTKISAPSLCSYRKSVTSRWIDPTSPVIRRSVCHIFRFNIVFVLRPRRTAHPVASHQLLFYIPKDNKLDKPSMARRTPIRKRVSGPGIL